MGEHTNDTRKLVYSFLGFLNEEISKPTTSADRKNSLKVATQSLETAFGITLGDTCYKSPKTLREIFQNEASGQNFSKPATVADIVSGMDQSSPTTPQRPLQPVEINLGVTYDRTPPTEDAARQKADSFKNEGNNFMKGRMYSDALCMYTKAIDLDGNNAVYFSNRSASFIKLGNLPAARRDVQIAIQLDPMYARAYGRLGVVHTNMQNHVEAYSCYKKAAELDPSNKSYENNMRASLEAIKSPPEHQGGGGNAAAQDPFAGMPDTYINDMAMEMTRDPAIHDMVRNYISNYFTANTPGTGSGRAMQQMFQLSQQCAAVLAEAYPDGFPPSTANNARQNDRKNSGQGGT